MPKLKTNEDANCPMCGEKMVYKGSSETNMWSCPACPAVLLEYHQRTDIDHLVRTLDPPKE